MSPNKFKIYITFQQKRICNFIQTLHCKRRKKNSKYIENPTRVIKDDETTSTFISIKKKKKLMVKFNFKTDLKNVNEKFRFYLE